MMTRLKNYIASHVLEAQNCENMWRGLGEQLNIDLAQGEVLDLFGADIMQTRPPEYPYTPAGDEQYRLLIRAIWQVARCPGDHESLLFAARVCTAANIIHLIEPQWNPLTSQMSSQSPLLYLFCNSNYNENIRQLPYTVAAGIPAEIILGVDCTSQMNLSGAESDLSESFSPTDAGFDSGLGMSELDCSNPSAEINVWNGGYFAELITQ